MSTMSPGSVIRQYRLRRLPFTSIQALAVAVGVTPGAVSNWELGRVNPRQHNAEALDDYLEAGGAILDACGFATPTRPVSPEDVAALRKRVDGQIRELWVRVEELSARVAELAATSLPAKQRARRGAGRSTPAGDVSHS